jgi:predicted alpha/beta hydrolase family esterase
MALLTLPAGNLFSVVTTADRGTRSPPWKLLRDWPKFGDTHVDYASDTAAQRNLWAARLDEAVLRAGKPVLLIASGESCFATVWWARLSPASYVSRVAGALLFTPLQYHAPAEDVLDKFASPRAALPFPSAIIVGARSRGTRDGRILALAEGWGSRLAEDGDAMDVAGTGAWQQAHRAVMRLTAHVVEGKMRVAEALGVGADNPAGEGAA